MERLRAVYDGHAVHNAGIPGFPRNYSRDSLTAGLLLNSAALLQEQLVFSSKLQGTRTDPTTGEEPGKIHHEYPGVQMRSHSTLYSACDTTALYLCAMETYLALTGDTAFVQKHFENIERAVGYITAHVKDGQFWEDPARCGAEKFALKVTYWKDSQLPSEKEEPAYPVVYTLAHFQNARALRSAAVLLNRIDLDVAADDMVESGFDKLWDRETFFVAVDKDGPIAVLSSDALHVLAYLDPDNSRARELAIKVEKSARPLETPCGYLATAQALMMRMKDHYHGGAAVWVFEQALIHHGAKKFNRSHVQEVSKRVRPYLDTDPELLELGAEGEIAKVGCDPHLWTIAAKQNFDAKAPLAVL